MTIFTFPEGPNVGGLGLPGAIKPTLTGGSRGGLGVYLLLFIIVGIIILPFAIGGTALAIKLVGFLFFTKAGKFPMWALGMLVILAVIVMRRRL